MVEFAVNEFSAIGMWIFKSINIFVLFQISRVCTHFF